MIDIVSRPARRRLADCPPWGAIRNSASRRQRPLAPVTSEADRRLLPRAADGRTVRLGIATGWRKSAPRAQLLTPAAQGGATSPPAPGGKEPAVSIHLHGHPHEPRPGCTPHGSADVQAFRLSEPFVDEPGLLPVGLQCYVHGGTLGACRHEATRDFQRLFTRIVQRQRRADLVRLRLDRKDLRAATAIPGLFHYWPALQGLLQDLRGGTRNYGLEISGKLAPVHGAHSGGGVARGCRLDPHRHVAKARGGDAHAPAVVLPRHEPARLLDAPARHVEEPVMDRAVAQAWRLHAQVKADVERRRPVVLGRHTRERRRERHPRNRRRDRLRERAPARADRVRLGACPRGQPDGDVARLARRQGDLPGEVAALRQAPRLVHACSGDSEEPAGHCGVTQAFRRLAEMQLEHERARRVVALRQRAEAHGERVSLALGANLALSVNRRQRNLRGPVVTERGVRAGGLAADGAAVQGEAVDRHQQRRVRAVRGGERVAEDERRRAAPAQIRRASRFGPAKIEPDARRAARGVHRHRLAERERDLGGLAGGPGTVRARFAQRRRARDGGRLHLLRGR